MKNNRNKIDLLHDKSESVRDVIGNIPPFYIRWGLMFILFFIVILISFSAIIKYPDIITANIVITTSNPPTQVVAQSEGRIHLIRGDHENVKKGDILGVIDNTADFEDVFFIKNQFSQFQKLVNNGKLLNMVRLRPELQLGDVQSDYEAFVKLYNDYKFYLEKNPVSDELNNVYKKIRSYQNLKSKHTEISGLAKKDLDLSDINYKRSLELKRNKVISDKEFDDATRSMIQDHKTKEQQGLEILTVDEVIVGLNAEASKLKIDNAQNLENYRSNMRQAINKVEASITSWGHSYVLTSAIDGRVNLLNVWKNNQYIKKGDVVMVVTSSNEQEIVGKATVSIDNSAHIRPGQKVNIRLSSHPSSEYGMLEGKIKSISSIPDNNNYYYINVSLPSDLKTTYNRKIKLSSTLQGTAEIITINNTILTRLFQKIRDTLHRQ
ncbi:HlyD family secretion protein [Pedobacter sp. WC2501]|uniref:HlyD family secretion protein n=1 Tax=Pedobacter sp. WC2501 TaxID=3461400 RepID=UPI0040458DDF